MFSVLTRSVFSPTIDAFPAKLSVLAQLQWRDVLFSFITALLAIVAGWRWHAVMDSYEQAILLGSVPLVAVLAIRWRSLQPFLFACLILSGLAIWLYGGVAVRAEQQFLLKYLLSSQSAILWMCCLFVLACIAYWLGLILQGRQLDTRPRAQLGEGLAWLGTALTWTGVVAGSIGLIVRWYESYLLGTDIGHVPVSNLYEVFVLFSLITALFYLYYEQRYRTRALGGFVLLVINAAISFLLWYMMARQAQDIQPLVPALQSWWMKLHVPANFIGYGTFSLAAMVAFAYLVKESGERLPARTLWHALLRLAPLFILGVLLGLEPLVFRRSGVSAYWLSNLVVIVIIVALILAGRRPISRMLPSFAVLDDILYRAISVGFAFFTLATILGALWAAEAWGAYWQWDPKETWALIVWLNYAAWLHMRLIKGWRGTVTAYWALIGLLITGFAFLGVNMFLSGLHSYGEL